MANPEGFNQYKKGGGGTTKANVGGGRAMNVKLSRPRGASDPNGQGAALRMAASHVERDRKAQEGTAVARAMRDGGPPQHLDHAAHAAEALRQAEHAASGLSLKAGQVMMTGGPKEIAAAHREAGTAHAKAAMLSGYHSGSATQVAHHRDQVDYHAHQADYHEGLSRQSAHAADKRDAGFTRTDSGLRIRLPSRD